jgi:hypothetical protein
MRHTIFIFIGVLAVLHAGPISAFSSGMTKPEVIGRRLDACSSRCLKIRTSVRIRNANARTAAMKEDWLDDVDESGFTQAQR